MRTTNKASAILAMVVLMIATTTITGHAAGQTLGADYRCTFDQAARAEYDTEHGVFKTPTTTSGISLTFVDVDTTTGSGLIIGNQGSAKVQVVPSMGGLTLLEQTTSGTVQVTVIYTSSKTEHGIPAVHSRHTYIVGPTASQSYGFCQKMQ